MSISVSVPTLGESVTEAIIATWNKKVGDFISEDEILVELETDKVSVEIPSPASGVIKEIRAKVDDTVGVGDVIALIEPGEETDSKDEAMVKDKGAKDQGKEAKASSSSATAEPVTPQGGGAREGARPGSYGKAPEDGAQAEYAQGEEPQLSPAVQRLVADHDLDASTIPATGPGGRLLKGDVLAFVEQGGAKRQAQAPAQRSPGASKKEDTSARGTVEQSQDTQAREERVRMTKLRQTIAKRLVEAQHNAAMLTTFNEVDMSELMAMRQRYQDRFVKRYDTKLGFMSFFTKAVVDALKAYPAVNAEIDAEAKEIIYKNYYNVGVAVGGGKGLVVPVIRDADRLSFAEVELEIKRLAERAQQNKLGIEELQGGTFTISNGGIYGSMLSTPILNPPQSGILGMHNIQERAVVVGGQVAVRPMMYLALSYDHRIVDGREAVSFLLRIKECIENPERMLFEI